MTRLLASKKWTLPLLGVTAVLLLGACASMNNGMSFFLTSANPGKGGDLGGLAGADQYSQQLATSVGAGSRTWRPT